MNKILKEYFKKIRNINLAILILLVLVVSGCDSSSQETYKTGTQGLVLDFTKATVKDVYEEEIFGNMFSIKNLGSYDISSNNPAILKISYDDYRLEAQKDVKNPTINPIDPIPFALSGKSKYYPKGDEEYFTYYFKARSLTKLRETSTTAISYNLCYPYATEFTTVTCIDTRVNTEDGSAVSCTVKDYSSNSGQGAPIAVTKIETRMQLRGENVNPVFEIYVANVGEGYVTNSTDCESANINNRNEVNMMKIEADLSGTKLDCGEDSQIRIIENEGFVRCVLEDNSITRNQKTFQTPLTINISYSYISIGKQEIEIKRNPVKQVQVTQGSCASYQVEYDGKCYTKCEYCSRINPSDSQNCQVENALTKGFTFSGFSCGCSLSQCNQKDDYGNCIKGYCPGDLYCCSTQVCDQYQVLYNGKCVDKCDYCANINPLDTDVCQAGFDFNGFTCTELHSDSKIASQNCDNYAQDKACIKGYCGGTNTNKYCANIDKKTCPPQNNPSAIINYGGKCINYCEYCASSKGANDDSCKVKNILGNNIKITNNYKCTDPRFMSQSEWKNYTVDDSRFCNGGSFCYDSSIAPTVTPITNPIGPIDYSLRAQNSTLPHLELVKVPCGASTPLEKDGVCYSVCEYCALNPTDAKCTQYQNSNLKFNGNFKCIGNLLDQYKGYVASGEQGRCFENENYCKFGYGGDRCCDTTVCSSGSVYYNGKCTNLCEYCSLNPSDTKNCPITTISGMSCQVGKTTCAQEDELRGNCIPNYCRSYEGTCYVQPKTCAPSEVLYLGQCVNRCEYCNTHKTDKYETGCGANVESNYNMANPFMCIQSPFTSSYKILTDKTYCSGNLVCASSCPSATPNYYNGQCMDDNAYCSYFTNRPMEERPVKCGGGGN